MKRDPRLDDPTWDAAGSESLPRRLRLLWLVNLPLAVWYFGWLLHPDRIGHPALYGVLLACEVFNLVQAMGFWWTCANDRRIETPDGQTAGVAVDVLIPTYGEPRAVLEPTIAAAMELRGADVTVYVLDDGPNDYVEAIARRYGAVYVVRDGRPGAKAGSLNNALALTTAPYVAVFDADHVPRRAFLERTLPHMQDDRVAFVQTPQYYANAEDSQVARGAWGQQALFFGPIARGKSGAGAIFCCGTNVLFRRTALESVGGFPQDSVTEDFVLSIGLHEKGWRTAYVPEVLAAGLGPQEMSAYVGQQHRWARGCLAAIPRVLRARLPWRIRLHYLLSSMFFLTGWTFLVYMSLPVIRLATGAQPVAEASADQFLLHFLPYFGVALGSVALAGGGRYGFEAFTLMATNFFVHVRAAITTIRRDASSFVVTSKEGSGARQPAAVRPALVAVTILGLTSAFGLLRDPGPGTINNVAFAILHITVLASGAWPALRRNRPTPTPIEQGERQPRQPTAVLAEPT